MHRKRLPDGVDQDPNVFRAWVIRDLHTKCTAQGSCDHCPPVRIHLCVHGTWWSIPRRTLFIHADQQTGHGSIEQFNHFRIPIAGVNLAQRIYENGTQDRIIARIPSAFIESYQAVQARNPVFALLHSGSTAVDFLTRAKAGHVIKLQDGELPPTEQLADELARFLRNPDYDPDQVEWEVMEEFSARASARTLAKAARLALERSRLTRWIP